jgi:GntR family transcriptional regulator
MAVHQIPSAGDRAQLEPGAVPLYYQLEQQLRARIDAREFGPGDCLPTEDRICEHYGVSRITVRRALDALQQQGLIERRRGVGSFVADRPGGINSHLTGSLHEFLASAATLRTRSLSLEEAAPPADVRHSLALENDDRAFLLRSVGSLDDQGPVAYLEIWFPHDIGNSINAADVEGRLPVIRFVEQRHGLRLTRAEQLIEPDRAGEAAARYLKVDSDTPILRVKRVYYAYPDRPIEVAYVRYHPERYRYAIDFK